MSEGRVSMGVIGHSPQLSPFSITQYAIYPWGLYNCESRGRDRECVGGLLEEKLSFVLTNRADHCKRERETGRERVRGGKRVSGKKDTGRKLAHKHGRRYVGSFWWWELSLQSLFLSCWIFFLPFFLLGGGGVFVKYPAR